MVKKDNRSKSSRHIKDTLMRILIASYLMGASAGIAPGPNLVPVFEQFMSPEMATIVGTAVLFLLAYSMMAGIWLRMTILLLAIILVGSSFMDHFIFAAEPDVGQIWRDVVILCALLQSLTLLTGWQLRKSAIVRKKVRVRRLDGRGSMAYSKLMRGYPSADLKPQPPAEKRVEPKAARPASQSVYVDPDEAEVVNIFA